MRLYLSPTPEQIGNANGVGKVVHAQYRYLPEHGIDFTDDPNRADIVACHVYGDYVGNLDVLHLHGMYWTGDPGGNYAPIHFEGNRRIVQSLRAARAVTMPSHWASMALKRDMRISPTIIPNGVNLDEWQETADQKGYALWNKNRTGDVCDPTPAWELASRGIPVVSTFMPEGVEKPDTLYLLGRQDFTEHKPYIQHAGVYLATTKEVHSLSVLESLACGVPVIGFNWGGTAETIVSGFNGYLVEPGDYDGLVEAYKMAMEHREVLSAHARESAKKYDWRPIIARYAALYQKILEEKIHEQHRVSVVITNYNYRRWVKDAIASVKAQTVPVEEILVVDDGSSDGSLDDLRPLHDAGDIILFAQPNSGVATARNLGIESAKGEYIICLDADDMLDERYVETCMPVLASMRRIGVVWSKVRLITEDGKPTNDIWNFDYSWAEQSFGGDERNGIPEAAMFRKDMWKRCGGYKQVYHPAEDAEFWLRGLSIGYEAFRVTDNPLILYRKHPDSASNTKNRPNWHFWHPWTNDNLFPFAAPAEGFVPVRSYSEPLVSVVIPVGPGHATFLPTVLECLLGQTLRNWEVIVVNDSGRDLEKFLRAYPFVSLLPTIKSGAKGAGYARNVGLGVARGELVLFLDVDDFMGPCTLEKMVRQYAESGGKYVYTDWVMAGDGEKRETPEYNQEAWMGGALHAITALLPRRTLIEKGIQFDTKLKGFEDWDFYIQCAYAGICGIRLPEPLFYYNLSSGKRRKYSLANKEDLTAQITKKYGSRSMAGCCGGNGDAIIKAKEAAGLLARQNLEKSSGVRLEFIGAELAPITFKVNGHQYEGAADELYRFIVVPPEDVEMLVAYGKWRQAGGVRV